jgi:WD40 repeat protein
MRTKCVFSLVALLTALIQFSQIAAAENVATLKYTLPEFRDISVWKSRAGLTRFSSDGRYVAVSGKTSDVIIYSVETGDLKSRIDGEGFRAFTFTDDGKLAVTQNTRDEAIQIYDVETGKLVRDFRGLGKMAIFGRLTGGSGIVNQLNGIWPLFFLEMAHVPVTRNWKNVLVNKNDKEFAIYNFDSGELKFDLEHDKYNSGWEKTKLAFAFLALAGGSPGGLMLLGSTSNAQFSSDGSVLMIANGNKTPTLWNVENGKLIAKLDAGERVFHNKFSPDGKIIATSDVDGITKLWSTKTGELISTIGTKKNKGIVAAWSKDGEKVFIQPIDKGDMRAYDAKGTSLYTFEGSNPKATLFNQDSSLLLTAPKKDKAILFQIWNANTGKLLATAPRTPKHKSPISIKFSPDGSLLALSTGIKDIVELWNVKGELVQVLDNSTMPMEFSEDGKYLATGGVLPKTKIDAGYLWELSRGAVIERLGE